MNEHTGDYYKCHEEKCNAIWDFNDFACPECGSKNFSEINEGDITFEIQKALPENYPRAIRLGKMINGRIKGHTISSFVDLKVLEEQRRKWAEKVLPDATPLSSLLKAKSEIEEIAADIYNGKKEVKEYADALMCIFDSAARQDISFDEIIIAYAEKMEINENRTWIKNNDNTYSHLKQ